MFLAPTLRPKTLEQLEKRVPDDTRLRQQEDLYLDQMKRVSDHLKGTIVLGQEPPTPDNSEEEAMTEELSEEDGEEETSEAEDIS